MNRVDLVIPGLFDLPTDELAQSESSTRYPGLYSLVRFGDRVSNDRFELDGILAQLFQVEQEGLPYAHAMNPASSTAQMLFHPVYLKADINNAIVFPIRGFDRDVETIINDLADFFKNDCSIRMIADGIWLMSLHHCDGLGSMPHYLTATGKKVTHYLERARQQLDWFKLFNEMQMFLHQHELNQQRWQQGLPSINSLWCWGGDAYAGEFLRTTTLFADDEAILALGRLYCVGAERLAALQQASLSAPHRIVVELSLLQALKGGNSQQLSTLLDLVESRILQPLLQGSDEIHLHAGAEKNIVFRRSMRWRFWRPRRVFPAGMG